MKRILFLITILLVTFTGAFAQSLSGTWTARIMESESDQSESVNTDTKITGQDVITFSGSSFTRKIYSTVTIKAASSSGDAALDMTIKISGSAFGAWKLEGSTLTLTPDKKCKPTLTVETKDCPAIIQSMIVGPLKKELKESLKEVDEMQISFIDETQFTATDSGETMTYKKIK